MAAKKPKSKPVLKSSSESLVAYMIAKMFGVAPVETLREVFDLIQDVHGRVLPELRHDFHLYPWECPLPTYVMADKPNQLVEDLVGSDGMIPFIVKDSAGVGRSGLWVVRGSFNDAIGTLPTGLPVRALVNHFLIGDEWMKVTAYQLETCLRKLRVNPDL